MLDELLFTLRIAREALPSDAHGAHTVRLYLVERIVRRAVEQEPEYWSKLFNQAEQITDDEVLRKLQKGNQDAS